jgi:hypothetical protein
MAATASTITISCRSVTAALAMVNTTVGLTS